jgi:hypothetical protein
MYIQASANRIASKTDSRKKLYQISGLLAMCAVGIWQGIQDPLPLWMGGMVAATALILSADRGLTKADRRLVWTMVAGLIFLALFFGQVEPSHAFVWTKIESTLKSFADTAAGGSTNAKTGEFIGFVFTGMRFAFLGLFAVAVVQGWQAYRQSEDFGLFVNGMIGLTVAVGLVEVGSQVMLPAVVAT